MILSGFCFFLMIICLFSFADIPVSCTKMNLIPQYGDKIVKFSNRNQEYYYHNKEPPNRFPGDKFEIVLRKVPHGSKPVTEYDLNKNAIYTPLVRYHVRKPSDSSDKKKIGFRTPEKSVNIIKDGPNEIIKPTKLRFYVYDIREVLEKLNKYITRASVYEKSGEQEDPLAPGKKYTITESAEKPVEETKNWSPHYSLWNYWTVINSIFYYYSIIISAVKQ